MTQSPSDGAAAAPKPRPELRAVETAPEAAPGAAPPDDAGAAGAADAGAAGAADAGAAGAADAGEAGAADAGTDAPRPRRRAAAAAVTGSAAARSPAQEARKAARKTARTEAVAARTTARGSAATRTPAQEARKTARKTAAPVAKPARARAAKPAAPARRAPAKPAAPRAPRTRRAAPTPPPELVAALAAAATAPEVRPARLETRHWLTILSFVLVVLAPFAATVGYLYTRAADRYHSDVAFSVRSEEASSAAAGLIGAITNIGSGSASDADILYEYVRSQGIVEAIDAELDLRAIYSDAAGDPVFTLAPDASIEALVKHWRRMVEISFESGAGIIHARAQAFTPEAAHAIAEAILAQSSTLVNELSDQARADAIRFAQEEFAEAEENLRVMRARLSAFRRENRIVDPSGDVAGQSGLQNALQAELAQALVERDVLLSFVGDEDQRVIQANRRITAVEGRIEAERAALGAPGLEGALPDVVGRYEELLVDLEFANTAYTQTLAGLTAARAEARRQSRYLAPHVRPTEAESALYPRRALLSGLVALFLMLGWGALMLIYYNVRDNR